jgi:uncharacterized metal-binding protein YceD (DUF177 family)
MTLASVSDNGEGFRIDASDEERRALARRFDLVDLPSFHAEGVVTVTGHGRKARLEGRLRAEVVQSCVVTLEPVPAMVEDTFELHYAVDPGTPPGVLVDLEADDPPEPIIGGAIDVGEAVAEALGLALDPYPRAPGAELPLGVGAADTSVAPPAEAENRRESPFAALKGLINKP